MILIVICGFTKGRNKVNTAYCKHCQANRPVEVKNIRSKVLSKDGAYLGRYEIYKCKVCKELFSKRYQLKEG